MVFFRSTFDNSSFTVKTEGNGSASTFRSTFDNSSTPNPFAVRTTGTSSMPIFGNTANSTSPMPSGIAAAPTGSFGSPVGFANYRNSSGFGLSGSVRSRTAFGDRGSASPFTSPFGGTLTTYPGISASSASFSNSSAFGSRPQFGTTAGPTGSSGSSAGFNDYQSSFGFGSSRTVPSRTTFGHPSNDSFGDRGSASPFTSPFGGSLTTSPGISASSASFSNSSAFGSRPQFGFSTAVHPSQNKGSKISPFTPTKDTESHDLLQSISSMPIYRSKSHEELRFKDYERNSKGSSSTVFKQPSSNLFHSLPPSSNSTLTFNNQPLFMTELSNSILSSTTNRPFNQPSSTISAFDFPSRAPTPSTPASSVFSGSSFSFPTNSFFHSPTTPLFGATTQPSFNQNSISIPPSTSAPSSTITCPKQSGTGNSQTNVAPSASTITGSTTGKIGDCVNAVKQFFGSKSSTCPPSTADPIYSPLIEKGISSMPEQQLEEGRQQQSLEGRGRQHERNLDLVLIFCFFSVLMLVFVCLKLYL